MSKIPKRKGWITDGVGYIPLTKGKVAIVNAEDVCALEKYNWRAMWNERLGDFYAVTSVPDESENWYVILMHRLLLGLPRGDRRQGDHWDGNTLDNRRDNLRVATPSQNGMNKGTLTNNKSGLKGVTWYARTKMWRADIRANGKARTIGYFSTKEQAHEAYCEAAKILHGDFFRSTPVERMKEAG